MRKSGLSAEWTYTGFIPADVRAKWDCADVNVGGAPDAFGGMAQRHRERRDRDRVHCSDDRRHPYIQNLANVALGWPLILISLAWLAIGCAYIGWRGVCSEAATMPPLETCTYFVLPALVLAIGIGTVWLTRRDARRHAPAG